jgi:hypothetical protein
MSLARWVVTLSFVLLVSTVSVKANSIYYDITDFHHDSIARIQLSSGSSGAFAVIDPFAGGLDNFDGNSGTKASLKDKNGLSGSANGLGGEGSSFDDFAQIYDTELKNMGGKGDGILNSAWHDGNDPRRRIGVSQSSPVSVAEPGVLTLLAAGMVAAGVLLLKRSAED